MTIILIRPGSTSAAQIGVAVALGARVVTDGQRQYVAWPGEPPAAAPIAQSARVLTVPGAALPDGWQYSDEQA